MSDLPPIELDNKTLAPMASRANDPHATRRESDRRTVQSVMAVTRGREMPQPSDPLQAAKDKVADLESALAEAKKLPIARVSDPREMANRHASRHWRASFFGRENILATSKPPTVSARCVNA